ncbi:OLC1v1031987C1 [Oldenlandia corymbosa var. corymbosa]|uniref:OLC1v1031987C1 n=1 Tax=Oldenlandia corymbosa var. corymbosa TaxID=529605 RepID=A0AAV1CN29_OLDCO|nr:OLC1v1031987C1 [Oldenlandia corymbosa var. corymbosa]
MKTALDSTSATTSSGSDHCYKDYYNSSTSLHELISQEKQRKENEELTQIVLQVTKSYDAMSVELQIMVDLIECKEEKNHDEMVLPMEEVDSIVEEEVDETPQLEEVIVEDVLVERNSSLVHCQVITPLVDELEHIDSAVQDALMIQEELSVTMGQNIIGGEGEFYWGLQEEFIDFNQFQTKRIPKKLEKWRRVDFLVCWIMDIFEENASWRHDRRLDDTFLWYRDDSVQGKADQRTLMSVNVHFMEWFE